MLTRVTVKEVKNDHLADESTILNLTCCISVRSFLSAHNSSLQQQFRTAIEVFDLERNVSPTDGSRNT